MVGTNLHNHFQIYIHNPNQYLFKKKKKYRACPKAKSEVEARNNKKKKKSLPEVRVSTRGIIIFINREGRKMTRNHRRTLNYKTAF